jgi:hypothetical protein
MNLIKSVMPIPIYLSDFKNIFDYDPATFIN